MFTVWTAEKDLINTVSVIRSLLIIGLFVEITLRLGSGYISVANDILYPFIPSVGGES